VWTGSVFRFANKRSFYRIATDVAITAFIRFHNAASIRVFLVLFGVPIYEIVFASHAENRSLWDAVLRGIGGSVGSSSGGDIVSVALSQVGNKILGI